MSEFDLIEVVDDVKEGFEEVLIPDQHDLTIDSLMGMANEIQDKCSDYDLSKVSGMNFRFNPVTTEIAYQPDEGDSRSATLTRHSMSQLCTKLGVPNRYIDKCIKAGRLDLAAENINSWVDDYDRSFFMREYDGKLRGILSDRYMVLDTPDILRVINEVVDFSQFNIQGAFISEERFHARIVHKEMLNIRGEDLFAGIQVDSSDVGRSVINIQFMIFKLVCTNGLILAHNKFNLFNKRHLGNNQEDFVTEFEEAFQNFPILMDSVPKIVYDATSFYGGHNPFDVSNLDLTETERVPSLPEKMMKDNQFSLREISNVMTMMQSGLYAMSRWGLINSITDVAKQYTLERRIELEKTAGKFLLTPEALKLVS